jgi:uncharacterized protein YbjT (DUF2867 family)
VTGATGYVGGQIVPLLLTAGYGVRVLARDPARLAGAPWRGQVEVVRGDVLAPDTLPAALEGVDTAFYLVHSMVREADFHARDLAAARYFAEAAAAARVRRIIYLGGLGDPASDLSRHLRSRHETGQALRGAGVPVIEFRAAIIVGAGSASFEMIRYLCERLPVMICPRWLYTRVQPVSVRDVGEYLVAATPGPRGEGQILEIGGADVLTYGEMMLAYARARGLRRWLIPVPVLTPRLSAYWVHWVTPIPAQIAHPLIMGLRNEVVVHDPAARRLFPEITPMGYEEAVRQALGQLLTGRLTSPWLDTTPAPVVNGPVAQVAVREGLILDRRRCLVRADPEKVYAAFSRLGGRRGWYYADWAWALRGFLDRLVGGVGLRRRRRDPDALVDGDVVDFWRVERAEPSRRLRLKAEMKLPGAAWLEFEATVAKEGGTLLDQTAVFAPCGLSGLLYWHLLYPIHTLIFTGLSREIARRAEASDS